MPAPRPVDVACGALLGALLAARGKRKGSLSGSGAVAALFVAVVTWGSGPRFGATLILFYLSGSKLTRVGAATKMALDEAATEGGERDAAQVLSCSLVAAGVAAYFRFACGDDVRVDLGDGGSLASRLVAAFVGFFAACAGDTWASELGSLSPSPPRLVTAPWRVVPPGTNGGVSLLGSAASAAGGVFVGACHGLVGYATTRGGAATGAAECLSLAALGGCAGVLGSMLDSLLGATLQATRYDADRKRVARPGRTTGVVAIAGVDVLSNHGVNALSAAAVALASPRLALLLSRP